MAAKVPVLVMIQGDQPGASWQLEETRVTTIGRSSRNAVSLINPAVSRFHCEISCINGLWHVADLNSKVGTYLNSRRLTQREMLRAGDPVRLSTAVFRFDLVDEVVAKSENLLAIAGSEARLGGRALDEDEALIEEVRARGLEEGKEAGGAKTSDRRRRLGAAVVIGTALVTVVAVAGALAIGHARVRRVRGLRNAYAQEAQGALASALAVAEAGPGQEREALLALKGVVEGFEGAPESPQLAAERYREVEGAWFDREMKALGAEEAAGNYRAGFGRAEGMLDALLTPGFRKIVEERRDGAELLAQAVFKGVKEEAARRLDRGDREGALALYRQAIERIGTPGVAAQAEAAMSEIQDRPLSEPG
ncbi:MAG: FHA domain-containing protein [Candidatus Brocadiia bacterium]|jgi:hypothetical protein|nr:FHA domain-containing protein [Candidatus Brocadiia bacterium]